MPTDHKKEWMEKASIDYFSPFISLWLACNSWYMFHYSDLNDNHAGNRNASDRDYINKLKEDFGSRNHLYKNFEKLILMAGKKELHFVLILSFYIIHFSVLLLDQKKLVVVLFVMQSLTLMIIVKTIKISLT